MRPSAHGRRLTSPAVAIAFMCVAAAVVATVLLAQGWPTMDDGAARHPLAWLSTWGRPLIRVVRDGAVCACLGAMVIVSLARPRSGVEHDAVAAVTMHCLVVVSSCTWAASCVLELFAMYGELARLPPYRVPVSDLVHFSREVPAAAALMVSATCAGLVALSVLLLSTSRRGPVVFGPVRTGTALVGAAALSVTGHATSAGTWTALALAAQAVHIVAAATWVGALGSLVVVAIQNSDTALQLVEGYARWAQFSFVAIAVSGATLGCLALTSWDDVASPYGVVITAKGVMLLLLGLLGRTVRRVAIASFATSAPGGGIMRLMVGELALMACTIGLAVTLTMMEDP